MLHLPPLDTLPRRANAFGRDHVDGVLSIVCVCVWCVFVVTMGELVPVRSQLNAEWARFKRTVHLANTIPAGPERVAEFKETVRHAIGESVARCRVERKRKRASETAMDLSDDAVVRAARFTDALPLANYDRILHLVPRLVNVRAAAASRLRLRSDRARARGAGCHARRGHTDTGNRFKVTAQSP